MHALHPLDFDFNYELTSKRTVLAPDALVERRAEAGRRGQQRSSWSEAAELDAAMVASAPTRRAKALAKSWRGRVFGADSGESAVAIRGIAAARRSRVATHPVRYNEILQGCQRVGLARSASCRAAAVAGAHRAPLVRKALRCTVSSRLRCRRRRQRHEGAVRGRVVIAFSRWPAVEPQDAGRSLPRSVLPEIDGTTQRRWHRPASRPAPAAGRGASRAGRPLRALVKARDAGIRRPGRCAISPRRARRGPGLASSRLATAARGGSPPRRSTAVTTVASVALNCSRIRSPVPRYG